MGQDLDFMLTGILMQKNDILGVGDWLLDADFLNDLSLCKIVFAKYDPVMMLSAG